MLRRILSSKYSKSAFEAQNPEKVSFLVKREVKQHLDNGKACLNAGKIPEAIQHYKAALEADPNCALCRFHLAYAFHEDGNFESARKQYEKAIELEPTCSLFMEHLGRLFFENHEYLEASRTFQRAAIVGTIQPISLGLWGRALFEQGLYEPAIETFDRLLSRDQQPAIQIGANFWMSAAYAKLGRIAAAKRAAEKILSFPEVEQKILFDLGENFIEVRCLSLARTIFERLSADYEESLLARLRLEDIRTLEVQIDEILPNLFAGDEERMLYQIHALREFGSDKISKALLALINYSSAPVRESILRYQTTFGYPITEQVIPLLKDPISYVREAAYDYFDKLDCGDHINKILEGLNDSEVSIQKKTAKIVGRFGTVEHLPELEKLIGDVNHRESLAEIRQAITSIKHRYQKTIDALSTINVTQYDTCETKSPYEAWRFWILLFFQILALGYFFYYVLMRA